MATKYRIKLSNGRIIGPFNRDQVGELYIKGHIRGEEDCQIFPAGDWKDLNEISELSDLIFKIINEEIGIDDLNQNSDASTIVKINPSKKESPQHKQSKQKPDDFHEFKVTGEEVDIAVDYTELEKKYQEKKKSEEEKEEEKVKKEESKIEATRIVQRPKVTNIEKTLIVNPQVLNEIKEDGEEERQGSDAEQNKEEDKKITDLVEFGEKTEFVNISEFLPDLKNVTRDAETEFELKEKEAIRDIYGEEEDESDLEEDEISEEDDENSKKKKNMRPIVALAFLVIIWVLFDDEQPQSRDPRRINIQFPVVSEIENRNEARNEYEKGMILYEKGDYTSKLLASIHFSESLSNQFQDNPSMGMLILTYAELYPNASNRREAASNLFRLIKIGQSRVLTDVNVAMGTAVFYMNNEKYQTAVNTIENFLRVSGGSSRLFAIYLEALIQAGKMDQAGRVAERLRDLPNKSRYVYMALNEFEKVNYNFDAGEELVSQALQKNPHQVPFLIELAEYQIRKGNRDRLELIIQLIEELDAERSPVYFAKYLEFKGVMSAMDGDNEAAARYFRLALTIHESTELRSKLASLSLGGEEAVEALILESRVVDLMRRSLRAREQRAWEDAFVYAIEATDKLPNHISARVLLSKLQIERGFFRDAIRNLRSLQQEYPLDPTIMFYYGLSLVEANQFGRVNNFISLIDQRLHDTAEFAELLARYYEARGEIALAIRWFNRSIDRYPLNDEVYYRLARIYTRNRNFDLARNKLIEAITLNPTDVYYRSAYAEILFDYDGASTAIGYLNEALETNPNHPKLIGDIAIYYFRNGQIRDYERYAKKLNELNTTDPSFYEFKVEAARLEGRVDDVVKYSHELLRVNPGDMRTRLRLAEFLVRQNRHNEAEPVLAEILERLESYPKANYLSAEILLARGNLVRAMEYAEAEIAANPDLSEGHFIKGRVYEAQEEFLKAVENYERSISLNPSFVPGLMGLANIKHRQNRHQEARQLYLTASRNEPNNPRIWRQLGFVHRANGELGNAADAFEVYLRLDPGASDRGRIQAIIDQIR